MSTDSRREIRQLAEFCPVPESSLEAALIMQQLKPVPGKTVESNGRFTPAGNAVDIIGIASRIEHGLVWLNEVLPWLQSDHYMGKRTASRYTELCVKTLEAAYRKGELRAFNCGKKVLFLKSDLDAWIQSHQVSPTVKKSDRSQLNEILGRCIERAKTNVQSRDRAE